MGRMGCSWVHRAQEGSGREKPALTCCRHAFVTLAVVVSLMPPASAALVRSTVKAECIPCVARFPPCSFIENRFKGWGWYPEWIHILRIDPDRWVGSGAVALGRCPSAAVRAFETGRALQNEAAGGPPAKSGSRYNLAVCFTCRCLHPLQAGQAL